MIIVVWLSLLGEVWFKRFDMSVYPQTLLTFEVELFMKPTFRKKLLWLHPTCIGSLSKLGVYLYINTGTITDHHDIARYPLRGRASDPSDS